MVYIQPKCLRWLGCSRILQSILPMSLVLKILSARSLWQHIHLCSSSCKIPMIYWLLLKQELRAQMENLFGRLDVAHSMILGGLIQVNLL